MMEVGKSRLPRESNPWRWIIPVVIVAVLAFWCAKKAAAQTVTITRLDGTSFSVAAADAGTRANPTAVAPNLVAFGFPGVLVLLNPGAGPWEAQPGAPFEFRALTSDCGMAIAETDPRRGFPTHRILGGELWPFFRADAIPQPPDPAVVRALLSWRYDLGLLERHPRLAHVADLFGDMRRPKTCADGEKDLGWLWRFKAHRLGGAPLTGWYQATCGVGSDGFDNWHYEKLAWIALRYARSGRVEDWNLGLSGAVAQACWGLHHTGTKWRGWFAYEKSGDTGGVDGFGWLGRGQIPDWGKQWFAPLAIWWLLTDRHPLLGLAVEEHLALLRRTPPTWWGGDWGERRPARYLDSLAVAYRLTGDEVYREKARAAVAHIWSQWDPTAQLWMNKGHPRRRRHGCTASSSGSSRRGSAWERPDSRAASRARRRARSSRGRSRGRTERPASGTASAGRSGCAARRR